ncbi:MAG: YfdX family protein [Chromatiaceae bacterium]|nr:YfdX family protein [Gammaproteobacteria bacterium]MCP5306416.1 YfdX family protein [Chromatiaceae bacterium]MCP5311968.1 YfdX family protein [Chromatiaceae bacterium]
MFHRFTIKPIVAALAGALLVSGPSYADRAIQEEISVLPGRQITIQDEHAISSAAVKVLRHIAEARGALQGEHADVAAASAQLAKSEQLLDIIQAALPTTKVKDRIWVARKHLEYEDTREVLPDLIPIYTSLDELVDYVPTSVAKAHLDNAKQALKKGDKEQASRQLQEVDDALMYVEADLPLGSTRELVDQAKQALTKNDSKTADQVLAQAEDNVVFVSLSFESPLTQAKAAIYRAWQESKLGERDQAKADLDAAVKLLERAARSDDEVSRKAVSDLVGEVRDLHTAIDTNDTSISSRIENAWQRLTALSERSAEYISTGWQRLRAEGAGKKELIEAKLYLAYARIDSVQAHDPAAAKVDLAEAGSYLDTAIQQVAPDRKDELQQLASLIKGLDKQVDKAQSPASALPEFHRAEAQLSTLIRQL